MPFSEIAARRPYNSIGRKRHFSFLILLYYTFVSMLDFSYCCEKYAREKFSIYCTTFFAMIQVFVAKCAFFASLICALAKRPEDRFPTVTDFAKALQCYCE
jgi:hypothetical protein